MTEQYINHVDTTFANLGSPFPSNETEKSGLEEWYERVYRLPFSRFTAEDLARSCRQNLFLGQIVPFVLDALDRNPIAGELFDGELFFSLSLIPIDFWNTNSKFRIHLKTFFRESKQLLNDCLDEYDKADLVNLLSILEEKWD